MALHDHIANVTVNPDLLQPMLSDFENFNVKMGSYLTLVSLQI